MDQLLLPDFISQWQRDQNEVSEAWSKALQNSVLAFSDSQIVTGIAILVSAYVQIFCGLQIYHWQVAVDLAFFSSVTHLTTLTFLREYFRKRKSLRTLRLMFVVTIGIMLSAALGTTGYELSFTSIPTWCLFQTNSVKSEIWYNWLYMCILLSYLILSYISRAIQLFPQSTSWRTRLQRRISKLARTCLRYLRKQALDLRGLRWVIAHNMLLSVYCPGKAAVDLYESIAVEVRAVSSSRDNWRTAKSCCRLRG